MLKELKLYLKQKKRQFIVKKRVIGFKKKILKLQKEKNKIKHKENTKKIIKATRKAKQQKNKSEDLILKRMHNQASQELSKGKRLSDLAYRNWNKSAYSYNKAKKRYEFKKELGRSYDVPKYIKIEV